MRTFTRRQFVIGAGLSGVASMLGGCREKVESKEVTAVEDLMREHGVLRRALFVYSEASLMLRAGRLTGVAQALQKTGKLFRTFGEEYHEKKLEEEHIFPVLNKLGGEAARYTGILAAQHQRGREITDYIIGITGQGTLNAGNARELAPMLESFVRMYRPHAAREDTIVFPAWKEALSARRLDEMNDIFEDIERQYFGKDGFENAVRQIGDVENQLGLADLGQFTPPRSGGAMNVPK